MAIQIDALDAPFGARVTGLALDQRLSPETYRQLLDAFDEFSVLVFPRQPLTDDQQVAFSNGFGPLETTLAGAQGAGSAIARMSNYMPDGTLKDPDGQLALFARANSFWHADSTFKPTPAKASLLSARQLPARGGDTEFASTRATYDSLGAALKERLDTAVTIHSIAQSRDRLSPRAVTDEQRRSMPPVPQAFVRENPANGRRSLMIGAHLVSITGMSDREAQALNEQLVAKATRVGTTYRHRWVDGDLVMWDNRCILHRGHPYDEVDDRRLLIRTTVAGDGPTATVDRVLTRA